MVARAPFRRLLSMQVAYKYSLGNNDDVNNFNVENFVFETFSG